jgi:hypothetical protein
VKIHKTEIAIPVPQALIFLRGLGEEDRNLSSLLEEPRGHVCTATVHNRNTTVETEANNQRDEFHLMLQ